MKTATAPYTLQYNGKELQQHANTTLIDYGARQYNPTLARWTAQDSMAEKYYGISPYMYCAGNPISLVDEEGEVIRIANNKKRAIENIAKIIATNFGRDVVNHLINKKQTYNLNSVFWTKNSSYNPKSLDINYVDNPWYKTIPYDGGAFNSMVALSHELFHAFDHSIYLFSNKNADNSKYFAEPRAVSFANYIREAYSLFPLRESYGSIKGDFHQFKSFEKISNFKQIANNSEQTKIAFSYTHTATIVEESITFLGKSFPKKTRTESNIYYIIISIDNNNNLSFNFFTNEDEYKKATANW